MVSTGKYILLLEGFVLEYKYQMESKRRNVKRGKDLVKPPLVVNENAIYTIEEAAQYFRSNSKEVYKHIRTGKLEYLDGVGRGFKIPGRVLLNFTSGATISRMQPNKK